MMGGFKKESLKGPSAIGGREATCLPRWRMTCWVDPQSLVLVAPNEAPGESGTKQRVLFPAIGLRWGFRLVSTFC